MQFYIFDKYENLLVILDNEINSIPIIHAKHTEAINAGNFVEISFDPTHEDAKFIKSGNFIAFIDLEEGFQFFEINLVEDTINDTFVREVLGEHSSYEMLDDYVEDYRSLTTVLDALTKALLDTRWQVGTTADLGVNSTNFYRETPISCIQKIIDTWGGEIHRRVIIVGNQITGRYIDILARRGADTGKRFEFGKDLLDTKRTDSTSTLKTALRGFGKGEETPDGFGRRIDFKDIAWSIANGDPIDKPLGQDWVGDDDARIAFGRPNTDETMRHRFGLFESMDIEDPEELLWATYNELQAVKSPSFSYEIKVVDFERVTGYDHEKVRLGDTVVAINDEISPSIELKSRVVELRRDLLEPEKDEIVVGQFLPLFTDQDPALQKVIAKVEDSAGIWDNPTVDDTNFPDNTPSVPTNFTAVGLFRTVQLKWDYDPSSFIASYEVYASTTASFTSDPANMVFRGKTGGFVHEGAINTTYYFRVRAVNHRGTASGYTTEISASTVRIITDDILFGAITTEKLDNLSVDATKLASNAVTVNKILDGAIANAKIASGAVTELKIGTGAITNVKLAALAVDAAKLADSAVTPTKIANLAVGTAAIANLAVTDAKINDLHADKITAGTINAARITIGSGVTFANGYNPRYEAVNGNTIFRNVAAISGAGGSSSTVIIRTPMTFGNYMTRVNLSGYVYASGTETMDLSIGFYAYSVGPSFVNTGYSSQGKTAVESVRLAKDINNKVVIIIKFVGASLSYPKLLVETVQISFTTPPSSFADDWTMSLSTDLTGLTVMNTPVGQDYNATHDLTKLWQYTDTVYIDGGNIYANTVTANEIAVGTITAVSGILADAVITTAKIDNLAVGTAAIANLGVTTAKIANLAVGTAQIADAVVTNAKIANLAVDSAKIADATITDAKIANATITSAKIVSLNADKIVATSLSAISANLGTITAGTINGVSINGSVFTSFNVQDYLTFTDADLKIARYVSVAQPYYSVLKTDTIGDLVGLSEDISGSPTSSTAIYFSPYYAELGARSDGWQIGINSTRINLYKMYLEGPLNAFIRMGSLRGLELASENVFLEASIKVEISNDLKVLGNVEVIGQLEVATIASSYDKTKAMVRDHNNSNVSVNAVGGSLYLGYLNTVAVVCSKNLDMLGNSILPEVDALMSLQNGWVVYSASFTSPSFKKSPDGIVILTGMVSGGAIGTVCATLPVGCRPEKTEILDCMTSGGIARIDLSFTGTIKIVSGSTGWVSFTGLTFKAVN